VQLAQGDPTASACYQTAPEAEDAVVDALLSRKHNGYSSTMGVPHARR
jgi:tyrosine aminotransferase